jgi:WASH complex subunit 7
MYEFSENVEKENLSPETKRAAKNLDAVLEDLARNFAEGSDYFKVLVDVFRPIFKSETHAHLRNFYMIIPALTQSFVERMLVVKEKIGKKGQARQEACFTDDGFALGLAYILQLLDQWDDFDSLHWWDSINIWIKAKLQSIAQEQAESASKKKKTAQQAELDLQHTQVTRKKLDAVQLENELLFYSFSGARIFFGSKNAEEDNVEAKPVEAASSASAAASPSGSVPVAPPPPPF